MLNDPLSVAHRWFEDVWNQRRVDLIPELVTPDALFYSEEGLMVGPDEILRRQFAPFVSAFPDLWLRIEDTLVERDQVVIRWEASGTHTGPGLGFPPTFRQVEVTGMSWLRIVDGRITQSWQQSGISRTFYALQASSQSPLPPLNSTTELPISGDGPLPLPQ